MDDFGKYQASLNNSISGGLSLSGSQQEAQEQINKYNENVKSIVQPIADEYIRQATESTIQGVKKGIRMGIGKVKSTAESGLKKVTDLGRTEGPTSLGQVTDDFEMVDRPTNTGRVLLRNDADLNRGRAVGNQFDRPHTATDTLEQGDRTALSQAEQDQLTLERAEQASQRSGQQLSQTGITKDEDLLAQAHQKMRGTDLETPNDEFHDAPENPIQETNLDDVKPPVEEATENVEKDVGKNVEKDVENFGEKFAEGEGEGGGPEDPLATVLAIGAGVASIFAEKKLEKKNIEATPTQVVNPNVTRGIY